MAEGRCLVAGNGIVKAPDQPSQARIGGFSPDGASSQIPRGGPKPAPGSFEGMHDFLPCETPPGSITAKPMEQVQVDASVRGP